MTDREYGRHAKRIYEWDEVDMEEATNLKLESAPARPVDDAIVVDDHQQPDNLRSSISNLLKRKLF